MFLFLGVARQLTYFSSDGNWHGDFGKFGTVVF